MCSLKLIVAIIYLLYPYAIRFHNVFYQNKSYKFIRKCLIL